MNVMHVGMAKRLVGRNNLLVTGLAATAMVWVGARVFADDAADIEQFYPIGSYVQYDNTSGDYPIITEVGSMPTNLSGHTYSGWSVFAEDSTGSLDLFISGTTLTTLTANASATLNVGDKLNVAGQWGPFHQIPEISFSTVPASNNYFNTVSTGNAVGPRPVFTISQIAANGNAPSNNISQAGFYLEVDGVTITGTNGFSTNLPGWTNGIAQETFTITDNTGSMTMFDWTTSYSAAAMLSNTPIGVGNVYNARGFVSYNTGGPLEFTPLSLTAVVPEPSTVALLGMGVAGLFVVRRRRRR